jgi:hypothetical protein
MRRLTALFALISLPLATFAAAAPAPRASSSGSSSASASGSSAPSSSSSAPKSLFPLVGASASAHEVAPDPTPLACDSVLVLTVRFFHGDLEITRVRREPVAKGTVLPRRFGRFAAELYVGPTLLERARFDFPLIQSDDAIGSFYAKTLDISVDVRVPDSDRPNKLELWDRASDRRWLLRYPPPIGP